MYGELVSVCVFCAVVKLPSLSALTYSKQLFMTIKAYFFTFLGIGPNMVFMGIQI